MTDRPEFSVFWFDPEGLTYPEARFITSEAAVKLALDLSKRPAAAIGIISKIMITDGGDFAVFIWEHGKGITFPENLQTGEK